MKDPIIITTPAQLRTLIREEVQAALAQPPAPESQPGYMTLEEVCEYLRQGQTTIRELVREGRLRRYQLRPGGKWLFRRGEVDGLLKTEQ